jgi:nucleotide-binding universal stress UspA family protein
MSLEKPIIAALDPHRDDWSAAALGLLLARITGAPLVLASAYTVDPAVDRLSPESVEAMRAEALASVEGVRARVLQRPGPPVHVTSTVIADEASPARAIHRLAERRDAAMLVVGSSARGRLGRMLPGAVTDRLLHGAPCPVAVATSGFSAERLDLIGVAFVERPDGRAALTYGSDLARQAGALVRILTVREPTDWRFSGPLEAAQLAAIERAHDETAERAMLTGIAAVPESRRAGGEVVCGRPHQLLAAASTDLDLLVCGSRGYGPLRTVLLGGVSHALVREAACPVLVVPLAEPVAAATGDGLGRVAAA